MLWSRFIHFAHLCVRQVLPVYQLSDPRSFAFSCTLLLILACTFAVYSWACPYIRYFFLSFADPRIPIVEAIGNILWNKHLQCVHDLARSSTISLHIGQTSTPCYGDPGIRWSDEVVVHMVQLIYMYIYIYYVIFIYEWYMIDMYKS